MKKIGNSINNTDWTDKISMLYHNNQYKETKQSTIAFEKFFRDKINHSKKIIDLGCGAGAATSYISELHKETIFKGIDYDQKLVEIGNHYVNNKFSNTSFEQGDIFNLNKEDCDGVISLQTLSWISEYKRPLNQIFTNLQPNWIGISSLFYEGDISCKIEVNEHIKNRKVFYNVYSLPDVQRFCKLHGYKISNQTQFEIDIFIEKPLNKDIMGTYTQKVVHKSEVNTLQISGPLLLNWYMVLIEKIQ
jgi:ubiquinone/menaquinone biosynthesis C-methylase UbiE